MKIGIAKVNPTIENLSLLSANTEYSYSLPNGTTMFSVQGTAELKVAVVSGQSGTTYFTVSVASGGWTEKIKGAIVGLTLYIQSAFAGSTARITSWQN